MSPARTNMASPVALRQAAVKYLARPIVPGTVISASIGCTTSNAIAIERITMRKRMSGRTKIVCASNSAATATTLQAKALAPGFRSGRTLRRMNRKDTRTRLLPRRTLTRSGMTPRSAMAAMPVAATIIP